MDAQPFEPDPLSTAASTPDRDPLSPRAPPPVSPSPPASPSPQLPLHIPDSPSLHLDALRLVPQPLAAAAEAAHAAPTHAFTLPPDDLPTFVGDLFTGTGADLEALLSTEPQYLQLSIDAAPAPDAPSPTATEALTPPAFAPSPTSAPPTAPPAPPRAARSRRAPNAAPAKRPRSRPTPVAQSPIRILPRSDASRTRRAARPLSPAGGAAKRKHSGAGPPVSMNTTSSHVADVPLRGADARAARAAHPAVSTAVPPRASHDAGRSFGTAASPLGGGVPLNAFPLGITAPGMIPLINIPGSMYPLQHHQPVYQATTGGMQVPGKEGTRKQPASVTGGGGPPAAVRVDNKKMRLGETPATTVSTSVAATPYMPPAMPFMQQMQQGMIPYDVNALYQMAAAQQMYAVAAAGYPPGVMAPIPGGASTVPQGYFNPAVPTPAPSGTPDKARFDTRSAGNSAAGGSGSRVAAVKGELPVVVSDEGSAFVVPKQTPGRLERHPVLGRVQLQSKAKENGKTAETVGAKADKTACTDGRDVTTGSSPKRGLGSSGSGTQGVDAMSSGMTASDGERSTQKKRLVWTPELHERFVKAIAAVGLAQAVPKTLVTIMNVEGLTTEHVKSHLQKYRNSLRKEEDEDARERNRGLVRSPRNTDMSRPAGQDRSALATAEPPRDVTPSFAVPPNHMHVFNMPTPPVPGAAPTWGAPAVELAASPPVQTASSAPQPAWQPPGASLVATRAPTPTARPAGVAASGRVSAPPSFAGAPPATSAPPTPPATPAALPDRTPARAAVGFAGSAAAGAPAGAASASGGQGGTGASAGAGARGGATAAVTAGVVAGGADAGGAGGGSGGSAGSGSVSGGRAMDDKELELQLMKQRTLQMQLQLQMMVHRTVALEKKLQQGRSGGVAGFPEGGSVSGGGEGGGDVSGEGENADATVHGDDGDGSDGGVMEDGDDGRTDGDAGIVDGRNGDGDNARVESARADEGIGTAGEVGESDEVEGLQGEQLQIGRELAANDALIERTICGDDEDDGDDGG